MRKTLPAPEEGEDVGLFARERQLENYVRSFGETQAKVVGF